MSSTVSEATDVVQTGEHLACGPPDRDVSERSPLDAALDYASRGLAVLPLHNPGPLPCSCGRADCDSPGKHPRTEHGVKDATTDENTIRLWWKEHPTANVGIATGSVSGIAVLDIDPRHDGNDELERLEKQHGRLPKTARVETSGGGHHRYFAADGLVKSRDIAPGVELKGDRGYVVAPASRHASGETYRGDEAFDDGTPLGELPHWVTVAKPVAATAPVAHQDDREREAFLEGERNEQLTRVGGLLRSQGLTPSAINEELQRFNQSRCRPALDETEVRRIAESVARYPAGPREGIHSATYRKGGPAERKLTFRTAREIAAETPEEPDWIARPWVAAGAVTEVDGKAKAAGKTTWLAHLIRAVLEGLGFMEKPTRQTPVVYLTEEKNTTLREALTRADLTERDDLHFLSWHQTQGFKWPDVVKAAVQKCTEIGASLLVVDTLPQFAGFKGDQENNTGDALRALEPLQLAAARGIAVVVVRHERKSGGEVGQSGRGSSAFAGAVDIVLSISRPRDAAEGNTTRVIRALSRFDETPEQVTVALTDGQYVVVSWGDQSAVERAMADVLDTLGSSAETETGVTLDGLGAAVTGSRTTLQDALKRLQDEGAVEQTGRGVKGDPHRYRKPKVSANPAIPIAAEGKTTDPLRPEAL